MAGSPKTVRRRNVGLGLAAVVVAVAPSLFGYLKARSEIGETRGAGHQEAEAAYAALAERVAQLQQAVDAEVIYLGVLRDHIVSLESVRPGKGDAPDGYWPPLPRAWPRAPAPKLDPPPVGIPEGTR